MSHHPHPFNPTQNKNNNEHHEPPSPPPPSPSISTSSTAAALQRLDDKLATGMTIADVANVRWLTPVEVLQYLDATKSMFCTAPPKEPPKTGTLLLYNASQTPNYGEDGIKWSAEDVRYNDKWMNSGLGESESCDSDAESNSIMNLGDGKRSSRGNVNVASSTRSDTAPAIPTTTTTSELLPSSSSDNMESGAWVEYSSCVDTPTFHRLEYRYKSGPTGGSGGDSRPNDDNDDIVLLHYLDSVRALRMTSELVDRIILLSADSSSGSRRGTPKHRRSGSNLNNGNGNGGIINNSFPMTKGLKGEGNNNDPPTWCLTTTPEQQTQQQQQLLSSSINSKKSGRGHGRRKKHARIKSDLGDTMNVLMTLVGTDDNPFNNNNTTTDSKNGAAITTVEAAVEENILDAANEAALKAVMKHISPDEASGVVDAIEMAMEENDAGLTEELSGMLNNEGIILGVGVGGDGIDVDNNDLSNMCDVTAFDIDEAIEQVLSGAGGGSSNNNNDKENGNTAGGGSGDADSTSGTRSSRSNADVAKIIEDKILDSMEEVLPEELKSKLIHTTEKMLEASGVSLNMERGVGENSRRKKSFEDNNGVVSSRSVSFEYGGGHNDAASTSANSIDNASYSSWGSGHPLPEIVDITPGFHVAGYVPPVMASPKERQRMKKIHHQTHHHHQQKQQHPSVVLSTETPIPDLPPYVDQFYVWEKFAAFVNFHEAVDDPQVQVTNVSFQRLKDITPFSYKCKIPTDIPNFSICSMVVVGVLLPKDHRVRRNMRGVELALKLCIQAEWRAAADLVGTTLEPQKSINENTGERLRIKEPSRSSFIAPCGGTRMQLLTQISRTEFTMYPPTSSPVDITRPNFIQKVAMDADDTGPDGQRGQEEKRKRDGYLEAWAAAPDNDASMSTAEVDRHRKVRFVERLSNAITDTKSASENIFEGVDVEGMNDDEIDSFLGRVLVRFVEVLVEGSSSEDELKSEINYCGYAGLSLLHHACFCNFGELISLLLKRGANPNLGSAEGDATPLHFAAAAGHKDVVETLIKSGCEPCPMDSSGQTPADHARKAGHLEIVQVLEPMNPSSSYAKWLSSATAEADSNKKTEAFLQSAFKELSLKDKLGLNLFVDQSQVAYGAPMAYIDKYTLAAASTSMMDDKEDNDNEVVGGFSFISKEDRVKLREAMSLASEMDLKEMNKRAEHQDVRRYLRQSNYEAISAASKALARANKKESDILKSVSSTQGDKNPSKMQLSRALAMLVLRKNLPA